MSPHVTVTKPEALHRDSLLAGVMEAPAKRPSTITAVGPLTTGQAALIDAAERERQDSLAFLHALIMG